MPHRKVMLHIADCRSNPSTESLASPLSLIHPCFCCIPSSRAEGLRSSCPDRVFVSPLASKPRKWKSCCAWLGLGCGRVEGVETLFVAYTPKASRLTKVCWYLSVRHLALPCAAQLMAARVLSYCIWYKGPVFIKVSLLEFQWKHPGTNSFFAVDFASGFSSAELLFLCIISFLLKFHSCPAASTQPSPGL